MIHTLLTVWHGSSVLRWSDRPLSIDSDNGPIAFGGGLSPLDLSEGIARNGSPETMSVSASVTYPEGVSCAELVESGFPILGAVAEVARWTEGDDYEDRRVYLIGQVSDPEYGADEEPVAFTIEGGPWTQSTVLWPEATAIVTAVVWPNTAPEAEGRYYPIVIGAPARSPALYVRTVAGRWLLIAGHSVTATSVTVRDPDGLTETFAVTETTDTLGRTVSIVVITAAAVISISGAADEYSILWDQGGGGLAGPDGSTLEGLGEVLLHALTVGGVTADQGRFAAVSSVLDVLKIGTYIDEVCSPWEWAIENLLPLCPILGLRAGARGIAPVLLIPRAGGEPLVIGDGVERTSPLRTERVSDIANTVRVTYDADQVVSVGPSDDRRAALSAARFGAREHALTALAVATAEAASTVASWALSMAAIPPRTVSVRGGEELERLVLGASVALTDADLRLDAVPALIVGRSLGDGYVDLDLLIR